MAIAKFAKKALASPMYSPWFPLNPNPRSNSVTKMFETGLEKDGQDRKALQQPNLPNEESSE